MKKIFLFFAATAFLFTSCNNDDDTTKYTLSADYLKGTWKETEPSAIHILTFDANTLKLTTTGDSVGQAYNYIVQDSLVNLTIPGSNYNGNIMIKIVNRTTFKLTTLYPYPDCDGCKPTVSTFKKK